MTEINPAHAAAILAETRDNFDLASAPPAVRGVWVALVLAMMKRRHTGFGLLDHAERLAEIVVGPVAEVEHAVGVLRACRLLDGCADGYLRAPILRRLGLT